MSRFISLVALILLGVVATRSPAASEAYPEKPIHLIVTVAPGGPIDTIARMLAEQMSPALGQPVIVDNKIGAGGRIGLRTAASADADGYTLLWTTLQTFGIAPALYPEAKADAAKLAPIGLAVEFPFVFVVPTSSPATTPAEFIAYAKSRRGQLTFGGSLATPAQLLAVLFSESNGLEMTYVPYAGLAPSLADLVSGRTNMAFDAIASFLPLIREGQLRALAVLSEKRSPLLPNVPTMAELGFNGFPGAPWTGIAGPPGTPRAVIDRINNAIKKALDAPNSQRLIENLALTPISGSPADFAKRIAEDQPKWFDLVKQADLKP